MSLLVNDWKYPVVLADLNPNDPLNSTPPPSTCTRWLRSTTTSSPAHRPI